MELWLIWLWLIDYLDCLYLCHGSELYISIYHGHMKMILYENGDCMLFTNYLLGGIPIPLKDVRKLR